MWTKVEDGRWKTGERGRPGCRSARLAPNILPAGILAESVMCAAKVNDEGVVDCTRGGCAPQLVLALQIAV